MASGFTTAKDALSLAGSLLIAFPWFRDFWGRLRLQRLADVRSNMRALVRAREGRERWLARPKGVDLWLMSGGIVMLILSFGIALLQDVAFLPS